MRVQGKARCATQVEQSGASQAMRQDFLDICIPGQDAITYTHRFASMPPVPRRCSINSRVAR